MSVVVQGGVSATALAFFGDSIVKMIPYLIVCIPLILLDLLWGCKAAQYRGERLRFSKGFRRTFGKMVEYLCWVILASTLSLAFEMKWIEWVVLGVVFLNELASIVANYLETRGIELSLVNLYRWVFKAGAEKVGVSMEAAEAEGIIKPKKEQPRDKKTGRFVKREEAV